MSFGSTTPVEIITDKLYWISADRTPKNLSKAFFINIDNDLVYEPFHHDFGPLDIGKTVKFVLELTKLLKCPQFMDCKIYHHTSLDSAKRANAAFIMGAFQIIALKRTAEEAWEPLSGVQPAFIPFRDALDGSCNYKCTILDCLKGLETAIKLNWFDIKKFDSQCYEKCGKVDLNWIIPGKLLAFSTPHNQTVDDLGDERFVPEDYISIFRKLKVKKIIRLNSKSYDEQKFTQAGFQHHDLELQCSHCPGDKLIDQFLQLCEGEKGVIAVHCKSGLGYTGTMIACYAMKHYEFPAASLIGWMRLCRPGSILGKQQQFLIEKEEEFCPSRGSWSATSETSIEDSDESPVEVDHKQKPYISKTPKSVTLKSNKVDWC